MSGGRRSWLTLLACLAAATAARAQDAVDSPAAGFRWPDLNWGNAPVLTSGSVSYDLRVAHAREEASSLSQLLTGTVSARTYIYEPWFATASGSLRLSLGRSRSWGHERDAQDAFGLGEPQSHADQFVTGNARLDVFPKSRFPFEVHFERTDSRIDSGLASTLDFRSQNIGFSQRYRPAVGNWSASAHFDHREQSGAGFRHTQDVLGGDFNTHWKHHELALALSESRARQHDTDNRTQFRNVVARHNYTPAGPLSVNTTVNWSQTEEQFSGAATDLSVMQWSSVGLWRREGMPLTLSGSVRGLLLRDGVGGRDVGTFGLTLGAGYDVSDNLRVTANGSALMTRIDGNASQSATGSVGASWQGDTVKYDNLSYDWFANGSAGAATSSGDTAAGESQTALNAQAGHSLTLSTRLSPQSLLVLSAGQTLSTSINRSSRREAGGGSDSLRTVLHTLAATWTMSGDRRSGYARASYHDSLELGGGHARFQLFNFQLSGNFELDGGRSLAGDITWQRVLQRAGDTVDSGLGLVVGPRVGSVGLSGEITFRQRRLFGMPRLTFTSRLKLAQDVLKQPGSFATVLDRETKLWENRLDWQVGRLETQLMLRISEVDGRRRDFLMWRLQRNFGE